MTTTLPPNAGQRGRRLTSPMGPHQPHPDERQPDMCARCGIEVDIHEHARRTR